MNNSELFFVELDDDKAGLSQLLKETELQSLCCSHINVVNLITSYQNTGMLQEYIIMYYQQLNELFKKMNLDFECVVV